MGVWHPIGRGITQTMQIVQAILREDRNLGFSAPESRGYHLGLV